MRNIQVITGLPFEVKPIIDITDTLPSRPNDPNQPRLPSEITHISVHHSAVEGGTIKGYADYHVNKLKWFHIGYHAVIKGDQIYQTNDLRTFSYHTSGNNGHTVSVSISGDLSKRPLTDAERNCLYATILTYMKLFNIPAANVWGHNEFPGNQTSCPCIDMNRVRSDILNIENRMNLEQSEQGKAQKAFAIAGQILYLYNLAQGKNPDGTQASEGNVEWAKNMLLELHPFMKERNLL